MSTRIQPLRLRLVVGLLAALLPLASCDGGPADAAPQGPEIREIVLVGEDGTVAFSHRDHWHGAPVVRAGRSAGYAMHFTETQASADDHDAPPVEQWFTLDAHPDLAVRVVVEDTTLARWSGDRVRGTLHGLREGASRMSIVVQRGTTTLYEAPPLNFRVSPAGE